MELGELAHGDQQRWNRIVHLVAWALEILPLQLAQGVRAGIAAAFNNQALPNEEWEWLLSKAPGYDPKRRDDDEED